MEFAVVDIETSGGKPKESKIIEIAIIIHDGQKILHEFQSLVNPEKKIDWFVTKLTGIRDKHVAKAPKFYEIAKEVYQLLENRIFVAHNVSFDYPIVRNEFKSLGFDLRLPHLCTIQSSRVLIPGLESYGLKNLSKHLNINLDNHHRAMDDTLATAKILEHIFDLDHQNLNSFIKKDINPGELNQNLDLNQFDDIPNKTGIYKLFNDQDELIYIGKSIHIKKRIGQHLKNNKTNKGIEMQKQISRIEYELTHNELIALLLESELIKKHQPIYNKAQKTTTFNYGLYQYKDQNNYTNLVVKKITKVGTPIFTFTSLQKAKTQLENWKDQYNLCQKLCNLYTSNAACFDYNLKKCEGACCGQESPESYNQKVDALLNKLAFDFKTFLILDKGKNNKEFAFVYIHEGIYKGYGSILKYKLKKNINLFKKELKLAEHNRDIQSIINTQLTKNPKLEIVEL
ncbi:MAG: exonuclease domain-containing protein [Putridiphycobacter sp.]